MYDLTDISGLLSPSVLAFFSDETTGAASYTAFAASVQTFFEEKIGEAITTTSDWMKQPFVWLLEFFTLDQFSNVSPERKSIVESQFRQALDVIAAHKVSSGPVVAKNITMLDIYSPEY